MVENYKNFILPTIESLLNGKQRKKIAIIRHYNTLKIKKQDVEKLKQDNLNLYVCYTEFNGAQIIESFAPFISIIRDMYKTYESDKTPHEFISQFSVYIPQRSVFEAMLTESLYRRKEEILLDELEYEKEHMRQSIINILTALAEKHPFMLVLNNLNMAPQSTIMLLSDLCKVDNDGIFVCGIFSELYSQPSHMVSIWEKFVEQLEDYNCVVDGVISEEVESEEGSYFWFESENTYEYLLKLNNMYYLLDFEQAQYYLSIIYRKIEVEKLSIPEDTKFDFFILYAMISLYSDVPNALLLCDKLQFLQRKIKQTEKKFDYYYILGQAQMYNGNLNIAKECADMCIELAENSLNDKYKFKAKLLEVMVRMSGWHNIFFCKTNTTISPEFIKKAAEYSYENHLAYTYIFAYDNDVNLLAEGKEIGENLTYYKKGIEIAEKLGNKQLLITAYRKNVMLSSSNGLFNVTKYYYYKLIDIIGDSNPMMLADIYNGLGYVSCAMEKYVDANDYYNKAIVIFHELGMVNYVGETLYNMSINCILADEIDTAYNYLLTCIRIIKMLHLNDLRVCNISKIFGLLALCSHKLDMDYNTKIYLDNTIQFLGHVLNRNDEDELKNKLDLSYTTCDDDIFLYYYVKALVDMKNNNLQNALDNMENARVYVERCIGNQFFSKVQYEISMAELLRKLGREQEAQRELEIGLEYAEYCNAKEKIEMIRAAQEHRCYVKNNNHNVRNLVGITLPEIQLAIKQAGTLKNYDALKKRMEFISVWQKIIDISDRTFKELIDNALNTLMLSFNIDVMSYIRYKDGKPQVHFDTKDSPLTKQEVDIITEYFSNHRSGFVTSKISKNFNEYRKIVSVFGIIHICSIVCIPYYIDEKLDSIYIMYILMKDNWNAMGIKYMLDEGDMEFFNLVLLQLQNSIEKLEREEQIKKINSQLEKSAITDYLTNLYNRDGFYQKVTQWVTENNTKDITFLYIDLDNFKYYNDTFGHAVGDRMLKEIAEILRKHTENCGFPTRFGGDEFLITLPFTDKERAMELGYTVLNTIKAQKGFVDIIGYMTEKVVEIPKEKELSCSIGIAAVTDITTEEKISEAIQKADSVLYMIKHSTKGDVRYSE